VTDFIAGKAGIVFCSSVLISHLLDREMRRQADLKTFFVNRTEVEQLLKFNRIACCQGVAGEAES
jgi:hypothetical protein